MKTSSFKNIATFSAFALLMCFCACDDDNYDVPNPGPLPDGKDFTISGICDMYSSQGASFVISDTAYLYAVVTADESSGNLYKQLYVQDKTGGINLQLEESANNVRIGDSIRIVLNGLAVTSYNNLMQITGIKPAYDIIVLKNECYIEPEVVTIKQLNSTNFVYTGKLVKIKDVQFTASDTTGTYADGYALTSKNLTLTDSIGDEVIVRNSGYANFANKKVIGGCGDGIFIVSRYSSTVQLLIRDVRELEFNGSRHKGIEPEYIFMQSFDKNFGTFKTFDVKGAQSFSISYGTACMTGYADNTNLENEDWLISPTIDLSKNDTAFFNMTYISRYFNDLNNDITLQISANYTEGSDPSTAIWTQVPVEWISGSDWNTFATTSADISAFAGQNITIAIKYLSSTKKAGTVEIKSISVTKEPQAGSNTNKTDGGTFDKPFSVADGQKATGTGWVEGYIIGVYETKDSEGKTMEKYKMSTVAPFYTNTNIIIADDVNETDLNKCMPVQLPAGDIRQILNLVDNDSLLEKKVKLQGSFEKYYSIPGLKTVTGYWINGKGIKGGDDGNYSTDNSIPYKMDFTKSQGNWTINDVELSGLTYVWSQSKSYGMKASAYFNNKQNVTESWLVSPEFDFSKLSSATLKFSHAGNYYNNQNPEDFLSVWVSADGADWQEITISDYPQDWTFIDASCDLDEFAGSSKVKIAFKYISTGETAPTWEIKSVSIE